MDGGERTNVVVIRALGQDAGVPPRRDPYAMEIDWERNCYVYEGFGHIACHCKNQGQRGRMAENRRLEYRGERIKEMNEYWDNLKGVENLESLD